MKKKNIFASLAVAFFCSSAAWGTTLSATECYSSRITLPDDTAKVEVGSITTQVVTEPVTAVSDSLNSAMQPQKIMLTEGSDTVSAQTKQFGTVTGFVADSKEEPLVNVTLQFFSLPDTTFAKGINSDTIGRYSIDLAGGNYLLRPSYLEETLEDIPVTVENGKSIEIDKIVFGNVMLTQTVVTADSTNHIKRLIVREPMTVEARDALIALYQKGIVEDVSPEAYSKIYDIWRKAFCARADRPIALYLDGVGILNATISADTAQARYDRIKLLNEELMDLFELAVINMDDLNNQLDKEHSDTLTVARLRAQQLEYLRANWQMDTVFNSPISAKGNRVYKNGERNWYSYIEKDGVRDSINWNNELFKDDVQNTRIYYMARAIVESEDLDVDMKDIDNFAQAMFYKFRKDSARVGMNETKRIYFADTTLARSKARSILAAISPDETIGTGSNVRSKKDYFAEMYQKGISRRFSEMDTWTIDGKDVEKLVANFKKRLDSEGPEFIDQILSNPVLATNRDNVEAMTFYFEVLRTKNEAEPTYARTLDIVNRAQRLELHNEVISYSQKMFAFPEFLDESDYQQARMYVRVVQSYEKIKGSTSQRYPYLQKAMLACPDYPEPYFYLANMIQGVNLGKQRAIVKRFIFCIAYDQFEIARQKLLALEAMGEDADVKSNLTVDIIQKAQARCKGYFPYRDDVFSEGPAIGMTAGKPYTLPLPFGKFTSIVRTQERTD